MFRSTGPYFYVDATGLRISPADFVTAAMAGRVLYGTGHTSVAGKLRKAIDGKNAGVCGLAAL